jgi:hypothetical protein
MAGPILRSDIGLNFDDLTREDATIDHADEILAN